MVSDPIDVNRPLGGGAITSFPVSVYARASKQATTVGKVEWLSSGSGKVAGRLVKLTLTLINIVVGTLDEVK
jgi:hypothetical protein